MNGHSPAPAARMRTLVTALLSVILLGAANAQTITIIDGFAATCSGTLFDSGGESGAGYGPGEDHTLILCPDQVGSSIRIDFTSISLGDGDFIEVFNGQSIDDPLLLTINNGNQGFPAIIPFGNPTGCMTLHFVSGAGSTGGNFIGNVSCYVPCEPPIAVASMGATSPNRVCVGEPITFDASASTASAGNAIAEYKWNFLDGTLDSLSGAVVTHAYQTPGAYTVRLLLTDNSTNECESTNPIDLQVFVATEPDFSALDLDTVTICLGESVPLSAVGTEAVTWSAQPVTDFGGAITLPDCVGTPFSSSITFTQFAPGATLQNIGQLESICVTMEHSYMGDLDLIITCPNGQEVFMVDYDGEGSGTGTFVGDANDSGTTCNCDSPPDCVADPGIALDYCWTPNATIGTFTTSASGGTTENVQPATVNATGGNVLIPGDYISEQPLSQLEGCPLNGTWTFTMVDNLLADDGTITGWSVTFIEELYPALVEFTPVLGLSDPDSAVWSGNGLAIDPTNPLIASATPTIEGLQEYVFSITDDFGCTHDTSMFINVLPGIPSPLNIIGDDEICIGTLGQLSAPAGFTGYTWNNGFTGQSISVGEGEYTVTVFSGNCSLESEPFTVTGVPSPSPEITGPGFSCGGALAGLSTSGSYADYQWSNGSTTPTISVGTGSYTVTVTNAEGCSGTSDVFNVVVGSDPQAAYSTDPVSPQGIGTTVDFTDLSQGNGSPIVDWEWTLGPADATSSSPSPTYTYNTPGSYPITLTITTADNCTSTITGSFVILPESILIPNVFTPNNDTKNDVFEIENGQYYENTLEVFDRWGKRVFEKKNYQNTWNAPGIPDGTYYYIFTTERDGKEYTGHVTILR